MWQDIRLLLGNFLPSKSSNFLVLLWVETVTPLVQDSLDVDTLPFGRDTTG